VVVTDRRGADLTIVRRHGRPLELAVDPDDDLPLRKVAPGGWSQRRYQQRAENTWETHARQIAEQVQHASDEVGAEVILVGGDVRAVELLEAHLPERLSRLVEEIPGGRSPDGSEQLVEEAVHRWEKTAAARTTAALLERFREERGQEDRAVDGTDATFSALRRGQVQVLLAHDDWNDDRRAWYGADPEMVATSEPELRDLGVADPRSGRLVDVALRAALGTGAGVWIVPSAGGPRDGIGAVLRWPLERNAF
jgi:peptide subunit release factor 1 (eRF1)